MGPPQRNLSRESGLPIACPTGGCALCGVGTVTIAHDAPSPWRPILTDCPALGGTGPGKYEGNLCPACSDVFESVGSIGPTLMLSALARHLFPSRRPVLPPDLTIDGLDGWAAVPGHAPNGTAWEHVGDLHGLRDELRVHVP